MQIKSLTLENKLKQSSNTRLNINGFSYNQWSILLKDFFFNSNQLQFKKNLFIFPDEGDAEIFFSSIKDHVPTYFYPDLGSEIYSSIIPSEFNLIKRFSTLNKVLNEKLEYFNIVTTISALNILVPPASFFQNNNLTLEISDIIERNDLAEKLVQIGYNRTPTTEEPGSFAIKGEIFDIYPFDGAPVRLHFFDDMIEEIYIIDKHTLITDRTKPLERIELHKTHFSLMKKNLINNFRNSFPRPPLNEKDKLNYRDSIFKKLSNNYFFDDYPYFISYFFNEQNTLTDYLDDYKYHFFNFFDIVEDFERFKLNLIDDYNSFIGLDDEVIKPSPEKIYNLDYKLPSSYLAINNVNISVNLDKDIHNEIDVKINPISGIIKKLLINDQSIHKSKAICQYIEQEIKKKKDIRIYFTNSSSKDQILHYLKTYLSPQTSMHNIVFINEYLDEGFEYVHENILFLSETDFFQKKINKTKNKQINFDQDLFAEQISTLTIDDFVIHKDFGIGQYKGIETLNLGGSTSDFIVLNYQDDDKVYVPVYKLSLIQKHSSSQSNVPVANLKTKKFEKAKSKAKQSVKKLAFDLLELQAKRKLKKGYKFSEPDSLYNDFSLSFKFKETPDQTKAINDVISDMTSEQPMDRLVCGDVGFGKTEVAMRAAFKAVIDHKQVAILVPTTVLAYQHYNSFCERFKDFPVHIDFISRFKTTKQTNEVIEKLNDGKIDILIGTHKILSEKVVFKDLGLLVIDEEQRFGVAHKEKMKLLRETVDTLTLTATPIPRTLQMSFLGIKELSVIKTPPPKRQTIKSYIIKEDPRTLKIALEKELSRGGQVFIVHNRVHDIEIFTDKIRKIIPQARIIFAHGQLSEKDLEKRITDFYNYKYDILISTTIIESGIDIPRANTMIIDRADTYGLSQLHQLRGRIGRSDKKAYAYFIVPSHKKISDVAAKRLKALQTYADLGSGFSLATSDLEIRGSGDILGPEQSGHIGSIGLELYMELLKECINEIKGDKSINNQLIEIQTPFDAYIPTQYIENSGLRLKYYKKISNAKALDSIDRIVFELEDQFGMIPDETKNLIDIIKSRVYLSGIALNAIKVKSSSILLSFSKDIINSDQTMREKIINFFTQRPKIYKINPDYSINCSFKDKITINTLLEFSKYLSNQLK